ncbi:MAG: hypothetical protein IT223_05105 [Crocinitomicaceae bacterium]|nr:hypothetical protein [Crocinitomicaceae bacterium]
MRKHFYTLTFILVCFAIAGCDEKAPAEQKKTFDLHRLTGRWESTDKRSPQVEEWKTSGAEEMRGKGYVLENGDSTYIEFLTIRKENDALTYFVQVSDQSDREIVPFRLSYQDDERIEFTNPDYDYPKKIVYILRQDSVLQVFIEGPKDGRIARETFNFEKR